MQKELQILDSYHTNNNKQKTKKKDIDISYQLYDDHHHLLTSKDYHLVKNPSHELNVDETLIHLIVHL